MSVPKHIVYDHGGLGAGAIGLRVALMKGITNAVAGGAGQSVATAVTFGAAMPDTTYVPVVNPNQDATWWISAKTINGFTVNMTARLAASTLAAGTFDVAVFH